MWSGKNEESEQEEGCRRRKMRDARSEGGKNKRKWLNSKL